MKRIHFLLIPVLLCWFCSCHKGNGSINQNAMLIGKWSLQQMHIVMYVAGVKQTDTTLTASSASTSNVQFNANGTFLSTALAVTGSGTNLSGGLQTAVDTVRGTYSFSGSAFSISSPVAGFASFSGLSTITGPPPVISLISLSAQINRITGSDLTLHIEYSTNYTTSSSSTVHKTVLDYYYYK